MHQINGVKMTPNEFKQLEQQAIEKLEIKDAAISNQRKELAKIVGVDESALRKAGYGTYPVKKVYVNCLLSIIQGKPINRVQHETMPEH